MRCETRKKLKSKEKEILTEHISSVLRYDSVWDDY
jgi:hypothetical protein